MSSEIVDGSNSSEVPNAYGSGYLRDLSMGSIPLAHEIGAFDRLGFTSFGKPRVEVDVISGNHPMMNFISPERGHKYVFQTNPTPYSLKPILDRMKDPSVLQLRGLWLQSDFPFERFSTTLTVLEISGATNLSTLPEKPISEMIHLQTLILSHLPIQRIPDDFLSNLTNLRSLTISACSHLYSLPDFPYLFALESLDLSHLLIEKLPEINEELYNLRWLVLRGCSRLRVLSTILLTNLEVLDLSHCTALQFETNAHYLMKLKVLHLSFSHHSIPYFMKLIAATHVFLRDATVANLEARSLEYLEVLDLSGAQNILHLDSLKTSVRLVALDLSRTGVESIDFISGLVHLRYLILRQCTRLVRLPAMALLTELEELDVSGCEMLGDLPEDLRNSNKLNISQTSVEQVPNNSSNPRRRLEGGSEFHLFSTFYNNSGFDRFKQGFGALGGLISKILEDFKPTPLNAVSGETLFKMQSRRMLDDLNYIRDNIDLLESSHNCTIAVELLNDLMNASDRLSPLDFTPDSTNFSQLVRTVVKLKLLVPPKQVGAEEEEEEEKNKKKKKKERFMMGKGEFVDHTEPLIERDMLENLRRSYDSLTDLQRHCLLYYAVFPLKINPVHIKERILIQLWYGEGFIDPQHEENVSFSSSENPQSTPNHNQNTIEEIGRKMLHVLQEKGFIEENMGGYESSSFWDMNESIHYFVRARAEEEGLFDFDQKNGNLTPHFCLLKSQDNIRSSSKICANRTNSSKKLESFKTMRTLFNVNEPVVDIRAEWFSVMRNLCVVHLGRWDYDQECNIREAILGKPEWIEACIDKDDEPIVDAIDFMFLDELKNMKQLRLLSLEGIPTITKVPDSVCKLTNLKVLNLRDCSYLHQLPAGIGSLKNLTHLDLTHCHILSKLPKGLRLLSKLEVMKGFAIDYQIGGRQHSDACTLRELLKLERLRKLSVVVNSEKFPNNKDVQVLRDMKNLCNLKITWGKNYDQSSQDEVEQKVARQYSKWQRLKCWEQQTGQNDTEEPLKSNQFENLNKLVLYCFPLETAPNWLLPSELQKLDRLYIVGGKLRTLVGDTSQSTWNVRILKLQYLEELETDPTEVRAIFPNAHIEF